LASAVLAIAPWTYRNWVMLRAFVPVATSGGLALYQGNSGLERQQVYEQYETVHGRIEQYRWAQRMGLQAIAARQPLWIFEKLRSEMPRFWEADSLALIHIKRGAYGTVRPGTAVAAAALVLVPYLAVLASFVAGLAAWRPRRASVLLLGLLAYYNLLHVVTHGFARYRLPVLPAVILFAAAGWVAWREGALGRLSPRRQAAAALLAAAFAVVLAPSVRRNWSHPAFGARDAGDPPGAEAGAPPDP
jgi:hypothetical protein